VKDEDVGVWAFYFAHADPVTATAVAIAEHGGGTVDPGAVNTNTNGSTDTGIWQINSVHRQAHPDWTVSALKDPETNARAMGEVSSGGTNWQPWATYRDGKYKAYMSRAQKAVDAGGGPTSELPISERLKDTLGIPGAVLSNPLDAIANVAGALANVGEMLGGFITFLTDPNTWRRVALVGLGAAVVIVGIGVVARGTEAGQTVESAATGVARKVA